VSDRIVVGIDGSSASGKALAWALDEARARGSRVTIVHAWRPAVLGAIDFAAPVLTREALEATAKRTVDDALARSDVHGLPAAVETAIVDGGAAPAILRAASDASLIVVGSRGHGGFAGLRLGSVSQHVIHHAAVPVVVVPA
jgi:nucleotide-binding universal stress UspA family protein